MHPDGRGREPGEGPVLTAEVENDGRLRRPVHLSPAFHQVEVDGRLYAWGTSVTSYADPFPGGARREVTFPLSGDWRRLDEDGRPRPGRLELLPGKYTVRVRMSAGGTEVGGVTDPTVGPPVVVWSNPVEVEVPGRPVPGSPRIGKAVEAALARLEGAWALTEQVYPNGRRAAAEDLARLKPLVITGREWDGSQGLGWGGVVALGGLESGTLAVYPQKDPAEVDLTSTAGVLRGEVRAGIFKLDGDTLTICTGSAGRPTTFEGRDGQTLHVYRRKR